MRFAFTDERRALQSAVRDVLARECTPAVVRAAWDGADGTALSLWTTLAELGVVGLPVPEEHGGLGLDALDSVLLFEEHGRFAAPTPLLETSAIAAPLLRDHASSALRYEWLPRIARGEAIVAVALAEGALVRDARGAHLLLLVHGGELHAVRPAAVVLAEERSVDRTRRLFRVTWTPTKDTLVAAGGAAARALDEARDRGALAASAELVGLAQQMVQTTCDYAKVRKQFGAAIGSFQAVKHHLASALVKIELARPAVYRAASSVAEGDPERALHVSVAKSTASDAATFAARVALQCHGAIGYSFEHDLHMWMKRAWALAASFGDAAWHRGRALAAIASQRGAAVAPRSIEVTQGDRP